MSDDGTTQPPIPGRESFIGAEWLFPDPYKETLDEQQIEAAMVEAKERMEALDAALTQVFRTKGGKLVWEWLWRRTIMEPTFRGDLGLDMGTAMGYAREGQNALIMEIYHRMERHKNG